MSFTTKMKRNMSGMGWKPPSRERERERERDSETKRNAKIETNLRKKLERQVGIKWGRTKAER